MSIRRTIAQILVAVIVDMVEASAYFIAIGLLTVLIGLALPLAAAFAIALLGVSICFGYRRAIRIERARQGEQS